MYSYNDRISYSEVNASQQLTYGALINYLQDCSCFHSDQVGVGLDYLVPRQLGWFVTNYEIHINKLPCYGQHVWISTYPYQVKGMLAHRIYTICDMEGQVLVYADSLWILMDLATGKPSRLSSEMVEAYYDEAPVPQFDFEGCKLKLGGQEHLAGSFSVQDNYIDTNGHMNNSYYIDVTRRFLPEDAAYNIIKINYKKAAQLFDELQVYLLELENGYQVVLKKEDDIYTIVEYR